MSTSHALSRVPVIDFILQEGSHYSCTVPAIVNRILSTHREFDRYSVQLVNWSSMYSTSGSDSAVLLSGPMKFVVEVELSDTKAEQLQGVMGRFEVRQDAPATICRILVDEFWIAVRYGESEEVPEDGRIKAFRAHAFVVKHRQQDDQISN